MKKTLALILTFIIMATALISCKKPGGQGDGTGDVTTDTKDIYADNVPDGLNYNGYEFTMAFPQPADNGLDFYIIGDGSGVTHSLSHASASGVYVARRIIDEEE